MYWVGSCPTVIPLSGKIICGCFWRGQIVRDGFEIQFYAVFQPLLMCVALRQPCKTSRKISIAFSTNNASFTPFHPWAWLTLPHGGNHYWSAFRVFHGVAMHELMNDLSFSRVLPSKNQRTPSRSDMLARASWKSFLPFFSAQSVSNVPRDIPPKYCHCRRTLSGISSSVLMSFRKISTTIHVVKVSQKRRQAETTRRSPISCCVGHTVCTVIIYSV